MQLFTLFMALVGLACNAFAVKTEEHFICAPSSTVYSSSTITRTPDAVTTTVQSTATYYTKFTKYRAARTVTVIKNVTGTQSSTCWPSKASLVKRAGLDDTTQDVPSALPTSTIQLSAPFLNSTGQSITDLLGDSPTISTTQQASSTLTISVYVTAPSPSTQHLNQSIITSRGNTTDAIRTTRSEQTVNVTKTVEETQGVRTRQATANSVRSHTEPLKTWITPMRTITEAWRSVTSIPSGWNTDRRTRTRVKTETEVFEVAYTTDRVDVTRTKTATKVGKPGLPSLHTKTRIHGTKQVETQKNPPSPPIRSVSSKNKGDRRSSCPTVTTHVAFATITAPTPTITKTKTRMKISTVTTRIKKKGSTTTVTRSRVTAVVATVTSLGGRTARFTDVRNGKAVFNIHKNTDFPKGNLATCECARDATCSLAGRNSTCASFEDCMGLCAAYNMDPDGPACMGVSYGRPISRIGRKVMPAACALKWIVPPHGVPQERQHCGFASDSVDSAVLHRQAFYG